MKKLSIFFIILAIGFCAGTVYFCVKSTTLNNENEILKQQVSSLEEKIDELENGEERLVAFIDTAYSEKNYEEAKKQIANLKARHPESKKIPDYDKLLTKIESIEKELELQRQKEEAEKERLANLNNTGMWCIRNYVDSFGDPTTDKYISLSSRLKGNFSNSAVTDDELGVQFLIDNKNEIAIKLFEYDGNHSVTGEYSSPVDTYLSYRCADGKEGKLIEGKNTSDRFVFGKNASLTIHNALMTGEKVKFQMTTYRYGTHRDGSYNFEVDGKYYDNAYRILTTGK